MYDSPMIPGLCYQILFYPVLLILSSSISIYLLYFSYSDVLPEIVFSAACLVPIALIITIPLSALARHLQQDSRSAGSATTNSMEESLSQIEAVQSLGGMTKEIEEFSHRSQESYLRFRLIKILEIAIETQVTKQVNGDFKKAVLECVVERFIQGQILMAL